MFVFLDILIFSSYFKEISIFCLDMCLFSFLQGIQGNIGPWGEIGPRGLPGDKGSQGPVGLTGVLGEPVSVFECSKRCE